MFPPTSLNIKKSMPTPSHTSLPNRRRRIPEYVDGLGELLLRSVNVCLLLEPFGVTGMIRRPTAT